MIIAITGARGRLAPALGDYLGSRGHQVVRFSRTGGGGFEPLETFPGGTQPDVVIHCAWSHVPLTAEADPHRAELADLPLLRRLLEGSEKTRFVFMSSAAIYGDTGPEPIEEIAPPAPLGAYARAKLAAERVISESAASGRALILRTTNLLGEPAFPARPQGILPRLFEAARSGRPVDIWGDGSTTKDYLHCSDFCRAVERLLSGDCSGIYNVGAGFSVSLETLIHLVEEKVGRAVPRRHIEHYPWDVSFSKVSCAKLCRDTGWAPRLSIEDAVSLCAMAC